MTSDPPRLIRLLAFKKNVSNSQSEQFNKEKVNDNEPPDIHVRATHQLIMKPLYPRLLQLELNQCIFENLPHGLKSRVTANQNIESPTKFLLIQIYLHMSTCYEFGIFQKPPRNVNIFIMYIPQNISIPGTFSLVF